MQEYKNMTKFLQSNGYTITEEDFLYNYKLGEKFLVDENCKNFIDYKLFMNCEEIKNNEALKKMFLIDSDGLVENFMKNLAINSIDEDTVKNIINFTIENYNEKYETVMKKEELEQIYNEAKQEQETSKVSNQNISNTAFSAISANNSQHSNQQSTCTWSSRYPSKHNAPGSQMQTYSTNNQQNGMGWHY